MIDGKKNIRAWALYDWANSAFATTVMAGFFPLFFKAYWIGPENSHESTFYLGMANSISAVLIAVLAPVLGAVADKGSAKKKFLFTFACLGIIMTGSLWTVDQGNWQAAIMIYLLAILGFAGGNIFYDSLLPVIASKQRVDYASSLGFALGYIGGGLLFLINVIMYIKPESFGLSDSTTAVRISFVSVAVWWALFSIPIFRVVREPAARQAVRYLRAIQLGLTQLRETFRAVKDLKVVALFLSAYWFYIDGVHTIIRMAVDYGMSLGLPGTSLIVALLMVQFVAFPATLFYGWWASRIGVKKALITAIIGYCGITFLGCIMTQSWHFYLLAGLIGLFQGGVQALSRSLYTRLIPRERSAEFFGFYNMMGKFAAVLGPAMMGTITLITGNIRISILSILMLFILGAILLKKVEVEE